MSEFLSKILKTTRQDLSLRKRERSIDDLRQAVAGDADRSLKKALTGPGISVIAEIKRASPSKGMIRPELDVAAIVSEYESAGARAVSILTEERYFKGSLDDIREARRATGLPLLRKDFIIDPYQVWEAAEAGADAVLLIVAALPPGDLRALREEAERAGLECLVEAHDREELQTALASGASIIGINNRDLRTFEVDIETTLRLAALVPADIAVVSESGIRDRSDVKKLAESGVKAILVGEALMRSAAPGAKLKEFLIY